MGNKSWRASDDDALIEQLRHACSVALGDLLALGMPLGVSTDRLIQEALAAVGKRAATETIACTRAHYLLAPSTVIVRCDAVSVEMEMPDLHARDVLTELTTKAEGVDGDYDAMIKIPMGMPIRLYLRRSQVEQLVKQLLDLGVVEATS